MTKTVLDIITLEQLRSLREEGYVVVHSQPTDSMVSAGVRDLWPEQRSVTKSWHWMVAESIRIQNIEIKKRGQI